LPACLRSSSGTGVPIRSLRAQIKWVALSLILFVAALLFRFTTYPGEDLLSQVLFSAATVFIPVSMTLAILRYRLYDVDRIISRTFGYLIVVAVLGAVYGVGAVWIPTAIFGDQSSLFVAASTLAAAALFNPVRRLVLDRVDRRFNRSRYDGDRVLEEFSSSLKDMTDIGVLSRDSLDVVRRTMQPQSLGIWVRAPEDS